MLYPSGGKTITILNIQKCQSMTFCRSSFKFSYQYNIDLVVLSKIDCVKDLGGSFDSKLTFCQHIDFIISKSLAMQGFIQRNSTGFNDPSTIVGLYNSLLLPILSLFRTVLGLKSPKEIY